MLMKRLINIIVSAFLSTSLLITGCSSHIAAVSSQQDQPKLVYSNLIDEETRIEIHQLLKKVHLNEQDTDRFIKNVLDYNDIMGEGSTSKQGYTTIQAWQAPYDIVLAQEKWDTYSNLNYMDYNCRLTSFLLYKNYIYSSETFQGDDNDIYMDINTIDNNPKVEYSAEEKEKFINFFAEIPVTDTTDSHQLAEEITQEWKNRGIAFLNSPHVSMINIFLHHADTNEVFIEHSGILVQADENLLFIEKYGPSLPYQVSKFSSRDDLITYLIDRLSMYVLPNSSEPIIMENSEHIN